MAKFNVRHWMGTKLPDNISGDVELTPQEVIDLVKDYSVMIYEFKGNNYIYLDTKGKHFTQR